MDSPCVFCRIIQGEEPASVVYEDEHAIAFLDIQQATRGHTLVIPKSHYRDLFELPEEEGAHLFRVVLRLAPQMRDALGAVGLNLIQSNGAAASQSVLHMHMHIVPRYLDDHFPFRWPGRGRHVGQAELDALAEQIRQQGATASAR